MSLFKITTDASNKDIPAGMGLKEAKTHYLNMYYSGKFKSRLPPAKLEPHQDRVVVRCDLSGLGFKAIAAEKLISSIKAKTVVYCAPRVGHASLAIAELARMYRKKAVFFAPAAAQASTHQLCTLALGAELRFIRIAAMPVLNGYARKWAEDNKAEFLPFGLANTPMVTAGIVAFADQLAREWGEPKEFWCATSTGTMIRGLQIGWPKAKAMSVAVARNMHDGEIGAAHLTSADAPLLRPSRVQPPFPTTATYDAKAWEPCLTHGRKGAWFINVGCDDKIEQIAKSINAKKIKSAREWGDHKDLERRL